MDRSLQKKERLCSVSAIENLIRGGRYLSSGPLRCCYLMRSATEDDEPKIRIVVSVPKKFFKRAVRRNLLKRRIREAYRLQKSDFPNLKADLMFIYSSKEVAPYALIHESVGKILSAIGRQSA